MCKNILKWAPAILFFFCACNRKEPTYLQLISRDMWKGKTTKDSVLWISEYKETANYIHYWTGFEKKPYKIDSLAKTSIEAVDDRTVFDNGFKRPSDDYKHLLKKGIIQFITIPVAIDSAPYPFVYIFRKNSKQQFKVVLLTDYFEALHQKTILIDPKSPQEEEMTFDEVSKFLFAN